MDTAQWPQEILVKPMEEMIPNTCASSVTAATTVNNNTIGSNNSRNSKPSSTSLERKVRPQNDHAVNCPRCNSTNTKFCYYNNYSLTQPRYFCKTCRRYWTEGGSLRNIPVGGGSRKNKRSSTSSPSSCSASKKMITSHDLVASAAQQVHHFAHQNPKIHHLHHQGGGQDLNLGFPPTQQEFRSLSEFMQFPSIETTPKTQLPNTGTSPTSADSNAAANHHLSNMELLTGLTSSRGLTPFMPMPLSIPDHPIGGGYTPGFGLQDYKPSLNFSLVDGLGNGYGSLQGEVVHQQQQQHGGDHHQSSSNGRLLFPFEDLKQVSSTTSADHTTNNSADNNNNHDQSGEQADDPTPGYWSGMLGSGGSW